jgi:hypothetical protein
MVIVLRLFISGPGVSATIKRTRIFLSLLSVRVQQPHSSARQIYHHSPVTRDALFCARTIKIQQVCSRNLTLVIICAPGKWMKKIPGPQFK